jgi:hypothetical protein
VTDSATSNNEMAFGDTHPRLGETSDSVGAGVAGNAAGGAITGAGPASSAKSSLRAPVLVFNRTAFGICITPLRCKLSSLLAASRRIRSRFSDCMRDFPCRQFRAVIPAAKGPGHKFFPALAF